MVKSFIVSYSRQAIPFILILNFEQKGVLKRHTQFFYLNFLTFYTLQHFVRLVDFTEETNGTFDFSDACCFGHTVDFDDRDFLSFASHFSFQPLNAGKLWEMLWRNKVTQITLRPYTHNLISLVFFWVTKTINKFQPFPPTNNRRHLIDRKTCIWHW